jgi:arsenate reductase-like glutaredoxin family protein
MTREELINLLVEKTQSERLTRIMKKHSKWYDKAGVDKTTAAIRSDAKALMAKYPKLVKK